MNAKRIFAKSALFTAAVLAASTAPAAEKLIMATTAPPQHWASVQGAEYFQACVKKATNDIEFNYFTGGQLSNANAALDIVNQGVAQISYLSISNLASKMPMINITMLPGMGNNVVHMTKAVRAVLDADGPFKKEFADNKVRPLWTTYFPAYQVVAKGGPIETLKDVQGKKFLSGGSATSIAIRELGGVPAEIPVSDMYMSMQNGTIDAVALSLASVKPYKLEEQAKSMTTNAHLGTGLAIWVIDTGVYGKLSPANQKAINDCGLQTEKHISTWVDDMVTKLQPDFIAAGVKLYTLSPENKAAFAKKMEPAVDEYVDRVEKRGLPGKQALGMLRKELAK